MSRFRFLALAVLALPALALAQVGAAPPSDAIRYRLIVDGPNPTAKALREGLDLARWETDEEMTLDLLERLVKDAVPQAKEIAAIEGFYDARVDVTIERDARPVVVRVRVEPGPATRVTSVDLTVVGPAATDVPAGTTAATEARDGWGLRLGEVFRQSQWVEAKAEALRTMRRGPYAAARISDSEARVEPDTQSAALRVEIDSGPPFRIGDVAVRGVQRYRADLVRNFSTLKRGAPYSQAALDDYVRRLAASGYFTSVQAVIDPETTNPDDATVDVAVIEAPTHRVEGAISFSTDTGYGARASYTNIDIDRNALQMRLEGRLESRQQLAQATFTWPPGPSQWIDSLRVGAQRRDIENTVETTGVVSVERRGIDERRHPVFGAAFYYDRQEPERAPSTSSHATYVEAGYVLRRVDDLVSPTRGWMTDLRAGVGVPGLSSESFVRVVALSQAWYPIDRVTGLVLRGEAGAVVGASRENVPSVLRFRTGGDTTVRGYAYRSLGVQLGEGIVAGRYYALASAEVVRWINETIGIATFVDAGDATDELGDFRFALGYGVGARIRTPVGPFRIDLAYGERTRDVRLHFSVGLAF